MGSQQPEITAAVRPTPTGVNAPFAFQLASVSVENLPKIRSIVRSGAAQASALSLAAWGAINLLGWYLITYDDYKEVLTRIHSPGAGIYCLAYGGLAAGCVMFVFAAIGFLTRSSLVVGLEGISLFAVGVWNLIYDGLVDLWLGPYGYKTEGPDFVFALLGISQIIWGASRLLDFSRIRRWQCSDLERPESVELRAKLKCFVQLTEDAESGVVRAVVFGKGLLSFLRRKVQYVGKLLERDAIFLSVGLNDCFQIKLEAMRTATFRENVLIVGADNSTKKLTLWPLSPRILQNWGYRAFEPGGTTCRPPVFHLNTKKKAKVGAVLLILGSIAVIVSMIFEAKPGISTALRLPGLLLIVAAIWLLIMAGRELRSGWPGN
jgi:hypothetical protein